MRGLARAKPEIYGIAQAEVQRREDILILMHSTVRRSMPDDLGGTAYLESATYTIYIANLTN